MDSFKLIPQLFYDLIARIIPGGVALWFWALAVNRKAGGVIVGLFDGSLSLQQSTGFLAVTLLGASYLTGQLIAPLTDRLIHGVGKKFFSKHLLALKKAFDKTGSQYPEVVQQFLGKELKSLDSSDEGVTERLCNNALHLWYDWLRMHNGEVGARITKLRAEYTMYERTAGVILIGLILHLAYCSFTWQHLNWGMLTGGLILLPFIIQGYAKANWTFQQSIVSHYYLVKKDKPENAGGKPMGISLTPGQQALGWVEEIRGNRAEQLGVADGSYAVYSRDLGRIRVEILPPPSPELLADATRISQKFQEVFVEMKRLGD